MKPLIVTYIVMLLQMCFKSTGSLADVHLSASAWHFVEERSNDNGGYNIPDHWITMYRKLTHPTALEYIELIVRMPSVGQLATMHVGKPRHSYKLRTPMP